MRVQLFKFCSLAGLLLVFSSLAGAQLIDNNQAPNTAKAGINKSLADEIGAGRGDLMTPNSSLFIIDRDPFRAIRRGRQIFQRKFTREQGQGYPHAVRSVGRCDEGVGRRGAVVPEVECRSTGHQSPRCVRQAPSRWNGHASAITWQAARNRRWGERTFAVGGRLRFSSSQLSSLVDDDVIVRIKI